MGTGFNVDPDELRTHAGNLESIKDRFDAVMSASSHIAQDDEAYGLLCAWIAGIMEQRHQDQDDMVDRAASNLDLAAQAIRACADGYEESDDESAGSLGGFEDLMGY